MAVVVSATGANPIKVRSLNFTPTYVTDKVFNGVKILPRCKNTLYIVCVFAKCKQ